MVMAVGTEKNGCELPLCFRHSSLARKTLLRLDEVKQALVPCAKRAFNTFNQ